MKITDIEIVQALQWPFVRIHTDAGISGIGEASLQQKERAVRAEVEAYREFLVGQNPFDIELLWNTLHRRTVWSGGPVTMSAISGIEQALWDIKGKAAGMPVYELLGGRVRERVKAYANGWFGGARSPEEHATKAAAVVAEGYDTIKWYPFGHSAQMVTQQEEEHAVTCMQAIREAVGPKVNIAVDVRCRLNIWSAIRMADKLQPYDVFWYEEPLLWDNAAALAEVARAISVPVATGERLHTVFEFRELLESGGASHVKPDVGLAGGLTQAKKICAIAESYHAGVMPHNFLSPVTTAAHVHLCAAVPNFVVLEHLPEDEPPRSDVVKRPLPVEGGYIKVPDTPGIGVEFNEDAPRSQPGVERRLDTPLKEDGSVAYR